MNFFQQQESARRSSRNLILLFALAVVLIVLAVNGAFLAIFVNFFLAPGTWAARGLAAVPHSFFEAITTVTVLIIVGGTVVQIMDLRAGGEAVARMVGARPIDPGTRDALERRLLNVIEEMALASGIAAPRAFVLDREEGINAFAAGLHASDAVIAVTRGTLARLTRDELQGVIGHEFSHILNGDMGLNLRLIGVLQGLLMFALFGRFLMSTGDSGDQRERGAQGVLFVIGLVILAVGYIGVFFGRFIKAAVSRQREFLADASSVQFTRNPDGIGGALRKIGGLHADAGGAIAHLHAETLSHMFMAPVSSALADGLLASHPPLEERLQRIYGRRVDFLPADELPVERGAGYEPPMPALDYPTGGAARPESPIAGGELPGGLGAALAPPAPYPGAGARPPGPGIAPADVGSGPSPLARGWSPNAPAHSDGPVQAGLHAAIGTPAGGGGTEFAAGLRAHIDAVGLRSALQDAVQAQMLVLAMVLDKDQGVLARQRSAVTEIFGADGAALMEHHAATLAALPPGWRLPLLDLAMPALRTLAPPQRANLLKLAHVLILADGRVTLAEFLLFTLLQRRLNPPRPVNGPGRARRLQDMGDAAAIVLSLIASVRLPAEPQRPFAAGRALLPNCGAPVERAQLSVARLSAVFDELALLAPLDKPLLVKACVAAAFLDGQAPWTALSCLRTLCAALDCPLPPQVDAAEG